MILFLDTETTDHVPGQICQLAWIESTDDTVKGHCLFFCVEQMSEFSQRIHGFSIEQLKALSCGTLFSDHASILFSLLTQAELIVGHNISADLRFLRSEFERLGMVLPPVPTYCTMIHGTPVTNLKRRWNNRSPKPPKLIELCEHFAFSPDIIEKRCSEWFGTRGNAHDARYDATATYMCYMELVSLSRDPNIHRKQ